MPPHRDPVPAAHRAWLAEAGPPGLRHALAEAFGDADARWRHTRLPLFDPAFRRGPPLPSVADPAAFYAALHPARRATGAYYTPDAVVDQVVALTWDGASAVLDPAVGAGAFLLGALRALPADRRAAFATTQLGGVDVDPLAVMLAQARIADLAGLGVAECAALVARVRVGDSLRAPPASAETVLTNPPFLNRLHTLAAPEPALAAAIRARHGDRVGPYTDVSVIFLLDALRVARRAVGIVLPASVCATRDAAAARSHAGAPTAAWTLPPRAFADVAVPLVALVFSADKPSATRRFAGLPPAELPSAAPDAAWNTLLAAPDAAPWVPPDGGPTLGTVARVEADFRDEYYASRGRVEEDGAGLRVVTSGNIALGRLEWGVTPVRLHKSRWTKPTVPPDALHPRQAARLGPAIFVATQTRLLEAAADVDGRCVAVTPVLTVVPGSWALVDLLAVLLSPPASAWAQARGLGSALGLGVTKLSAGQLRELPLPPAVPEGARAAAARVAAGDDAAVDELAAAMNDAWGAPAELLEWWRGRR